jgi:hypothetical protein
MVSRRKRRGLESAGGEISEDEVEKRGMKRKTPTKKKSKGSDSDDDDFVQEDEESEEELDVVPELDLENNNNNDIASDTELPPIKKKPNRKPRSKKNQNSSPSTPEEKKEYDFDMIDYKIPEFCVPQQSEPPKELSSAITMLPFQLESLTWLQNQEKSEICKGGILAGTDIKHA